MKARRKTQHTYSLTAYDAYVLQQAADVLDGAWGAGPQRYLRRYLRILPRYHRLKQAGVKVGITGPELGWRGPFLIVEGKKADDRQRNI